MLVALDALAVRRWCAVGCAALERARAEIDALNVFPVPDGDTGTNLALTMRAVVDALERVDGDLSVTMRAVARAALTGARGNSGVILSEMLRGLAEAWAGCAAASGADLQRALLRASDAAYAAVAEPVEGTVLSVARAAASAAAAVERGDLAAVSRTATRAAAEALERTPRQLAALSAAGVVDAGGRGLVVLLDALTAVVTGETPGPTGSARADAMPVDVPGVGPATVRLREAGSATFGYEVQYLLDAPDDAMPALRDRLAALGDSLVVVGGDGLHNVHVHVNDVGSAIEAGVEVGRPHRISVTRFADHLALPTEVTGGGAQAAQVVAVVPGDGLGRLFARAGALTVDAGGGAAPSAGQLRDAVLATGADRVVLLPNARDLRAVADAAARMACDLGRTVVVLPTRSPVQGLAALAVHDAGRRFDDDVAAMSAAAAATRVADVSLAVRAAMTSGGACRAGDVVGRIDSDVVAVGDDVPTVARGLLDRLLIGGGELVTLITGADAAPDLTHGLVGYLAATRPGVDAVTYVGGQHRFPLLIGVE